MSFSTADNDIASALASVNAVGSPDIRRRETDVPAVTWSIIDSNPSESATGSMAPYFTQWELVAYELSRVDAERLADSALAALVSSSDFDHVREVSRSPDLLIRGVDTTPLYTSQLIVAITFGN